MTSGLYFDSHAPPTMLPILILTVGNSPPPHPPPNVYQTEFPPCFTHSATESHPVEAALPVKAYYYFIFSETSRMCEVLASFHCPHKGDELQPQIYSTNKTIYSSYQSLQKTAKKVVREA